MSAVPLVSNNNNAAGPAPTLPVPQQALFRVLTAISFCHLLNDMVQSLLPSIYPILKTTFHLDFSQIGLLTLTYQITASLLQPFIGLYTDRRPVPYSLPVGMAFTLSGLLILAVAATFPVLLIASSLIGVGSAIFHPESSRVARLASGGRHGMAQSFSRLAGIRDRPLAHCWRWRSCCREDRSARRGSRFRRCGNRGADMGRRMVQEPDFSVHPDPRRHDASEERSPTETSGASDRGFDRPHLLEILLSRRASPSYFTFYLISHFHVSVKSSQLHLFAFLGAVAAGTMIGGPVGDRFGRKAVIWCSIFGVLPFSLMLPRADLFWTGVLSVIIGFVIALAFSAILVYAQELVPGRVGMISGLFFGFAFGMGGIGAAVLGWLADRTSIDFVYRICAFLRRSDCAPACCRI